MKNFQLAFIYSSFLIPIFLCDNSTSSSSTAYLSSSTSTSYPSTGNANTTTTATTINSGSNPTNADKSGTTTDPSLLNSISGEKLVSYTTKQKTIFIVTCSTTFVLLIALAILSGLSDTIARSRQKAKRTHA